MGANLNRGRGQILTKETVSPFENCYLQRIANKLTDFFEKL
jgi:hypothetical protein